MVDTKVLVGVITDEYARRADFYDYYNLLEKPPDTFVAFCHDRSPAHGRNQLIEAAKEHNCTHILFIDDDMAYEPNSLVRLLKHDLDVVSGLYLSRAYPHQPLIFDKNDRDAAYFTYLEDGKTGLYPIENCGFGFVLIKMSVFAKLDKPDVRLGELDAEQWCDDVGFFIRVHNAGIKMWADLDVKVGHMGTMIVWPDYEDGKWYTAYDTNGKARIKTPQIIIPEYAINKV